MKVIGITGSIASGKSFVASCFEELGYEVFDSDRQSHLIMQDKAVIDEISGAFPECIKNGMIDRKLLGNMVFANKENKSALEGIIHPKIAEKRQLFLSDSKARNSDLVLFDSPLLFESGVDKICDYVIVTKSPSDLQKERALKRDFMSEEKYQKILSMQMPESKKISKADFVIDTSKDKGAIMEQISNIVSGVTRK